jgi:hypothetical protein
MRFESFATLDEAWGGDFGGRTTTIRKASLTSPSCGPPSTADFHARKASNGHSDPWCDLYYDGFNHDIDRIMDMYTAGDEQAADVRGGGKASSRPYAKTMGIDDDDDGPTAYNGGTLAPYGTRANVANDENRHWQQRSSSYDTDDDDEDSYAGVPPSAPATNHDDAKTAKTMTTAQQGGASSSPARQAPPPTSITTTSEQFFDQPQNANRMSTSDDSSSSSSISKTYGSNNNSSSSTNSYKTTYFAEMALYIISGILLIIIMEQFVQIGVRMRT